MKPEIKKLWVDALRSGEYKQGTCKLRTDDKYCCLGVLTDLYFKKTGQGSWTDTPYCKGIFYFNCESGSDDQHLVSEIKGWAGLESFCPLSKEKRKALTELNDNGMSFEDIAEIIEADRSI